MVPGVSSRNVHVLAWKLSEICPVIGNALLNEWSKFYRFPSFRSQVCSFIPLWPYSYRTFKLLLPYANTRNTTLDQHRGQEHFSNWLVQSNCWSFHWKEGSHSATPATRGRMRLSSKSMGPVSIKTASFLSRTLKHQEIQGASPGKSSLHKEILQDKWSGLWHCAAEVELNFLPRIVLKITLVGVGK